VTARSSVLVAMSGGVDSSVAAALLVQAGHEVVGATMKLWGGRSDSGCCSIGDVDDARRVADQLGIEHQTFNFGDEFTEHVVDPYVAAHAAGRTPNPCIECNRHLKFDRLLRRADALGFDLVATGHHARIVQDAAGDLRVARGVDPAKDQSYVLHMLGARQLDRLRFPVGAHTKAEVRRLAEDLGLRTAHKPESQDVCFITSDTRRRGFLGARLAFTPARVQDVAGEVVGRVEQVELVTIGQRRGLGLAGGAAPRYVVDVDVAERVVTVGDRRDLLEERMVVDDVAWSAGSTPPSSQPPAVVFVQCSAHGAPASARLERGDHAASVVVRWAEPHRRVAPGQSVVFYDGDLVLGGGVAARSTHHGR
jgi:tRNA-specific 2-thiouridylase